VVSVYPPDAFVVFVCPATVTNVELLSERCSVMVWFLMAVVPLASVPVTVKFLLTFALAGAAVVSVVGYVIAEAMVVFRVFRVQRTPNATQGPYFASHVN